MKHTKKKTTIHRKSRRRGGDRGRGGRWMSAIATLQWSSGKWTMFLLYSKHSIIPKKNNTKISCLILFYNIKSTWRSGSVRMARIHSINKSKDNIYARNKKKREKRGVWLSVCPWFFHEFEIFKTTTKKIINDEANIEKGDISMVLVDWPAVSPIMALNSHVLSHSLSFTSPIDFNSKWQQWHYTVLRQRRQQLLLLLLLLQKCLSHFIRNGRSV